MTQTSPDPDVRMPRRHGRPQRARGQQSREKILSAAREIVMNRGYDGTSMAEVSRRCGLPTSSIYWHFSDKDDLMSHVIRDSFQVWSSIWDVSTDMDVLKELPQIFMNAAVALRDSPEFLRLGLQLSLQQRTDDPAARRMYLAHRRDAVSRLNQIAQSHFPMVSTSSRESIVSFIIASIDGLFIAREIDPDVDIDRQISLLVNALILLIGDAVKAATPDTSTNEGTPVNSPTQKQLEDLATQLRGARDGATGIEPPTETHPGMTIPLAYQVQSINRARDLEAGHRIVGHKIGLTSLAMQRQLGVDEPDYGYLTDQMVIANGASVPHSDFVAPRAEPEIAFRLSQDLDATSTKVTAEDVRAATDAVAVALEIVDSRVADWKIKLPDTIADNASSASVVLGPWVPLAGVGNLTELQADLLIDGQVVDSGVGSAVLGDPAEAVAWLINAYGDLGEKVSAGEFIISGAMCASAWIHAGHSTAARIDGLGEVSLNFTEDNGSGVPEFVRPAISAVSAVAAVLPEASVDYAEVVTVRPGGVPGQSAEAEKKTAETDPDAGIAAITAALANVGALQGKAIMLINPAVPPISPAATVTCLIGAGVNDSTLRRLSDAVGAAVGERLISEVTTAPVGVQSATCPVGPKAVAVSMTLDLSGLEA